MGISPFEADLGYIPLMPATLGVVPAKIGNADALPSVKNFMKEMEDTIELVKLRMQEAQRKQAKYYDDHWTEDPNFAVGELVMLQRDGLNLDQATNRVGLLTPYIGPFPVEQKEGLNYTLKLPTSMKVHSTFHVERLKKYHRPDEGFPGRPVPD